MSEIETARAPIGVPARQGTEKQRGDGESGFVLISVFAALLLLAIIASTVMMSTRTQQKVRIAVNTRTELAALADGMARLTGLRLSERQGSADPTIRLVVDGSPMLCRDGDTVVEVRITDTAGLIDINAASQDSIDLLLRGLGLPRVEAKRLAGAIQDFRDFDGIATTGGTEAEVYIKAGRGFGAKNGAIEAIDELDQVPGMTPEILAGLRRFLTVYSRAPGVDPTVAPMALLETLANASGGGATSPATGPLRRDQFPLPPELVVRANPRAASRSRVRAFVVDVIAARGDARFHRSAVIELSPLAEVGFVVREWTSRPDAVTPSGGIGAATAPCPTMQ